MANCNEDPATMPQPLLDPAYLGRANVHTSAALGELVLNPDLDAIKTTISIWDTSARDKAFYCLPVKLWQVLPKQLPQSAVYLHGRSRIVLVACSQIVSHAALSILSSRALPGGAC